jgi:hypothetical protein
LAGVSVSEWTVFRQLCEINRARSDQDEPFDRIKLEHIRAFERQPKEPRQKIDGELE